MFPRKSKVFGSLLAALGALILAAPANARPRVDVVVLDNGDRITGRIESLRQGILSFSTDNMGTLSIEWLHVASVVTPYVYQIEMADGAILLGTLSGATEAGKLTVGSAENAQLARKNDMLRMAPMQSRILDRFDGSVSAGITYTKGNDQTQINLGLNATYLSEKFQATVAASSLSTSGGDAEDTARDTLNFTYRRLRPNRWFGAGIAQAQRNEQLGVDLRASVGGGYGRFVLQNQHTTVALTGGLLLTREWNVGDTDETVTDLEAYLALSHRYFIFDSPTVSFTNDLAIYPGLTNWGSLRAEFDSTLRWEIINDLDWSLQFYGSYDGERGETSDATADYGVVTGLAYSF